MRRKIMIQVGEPAFKFNSYEQWVNKAQSWFSSASLDNGKAVCVDMAGRVCRIGRDFMRARDDGSFPVTVYPLEV